MRPPAPDHPAAPGRSALPWPLRVLLWFVLPALAGGLGLGALAALHVTAGDGLRTLSVLWLLAWPLWLLVVAGGAVMAWRAAAKALAQGAPVGGVRAGQALVAAGALVSVGAAALSFAPHLGEHLQLAQGIDPLGQVQATVSADGRRLRLRGAVGLGDARRVIDQLGAAPRARLLELDMPGGRWAEARAIADAVRRVGWQTRVVGACDNACALIFLAGGARQLMPGASLAFHRPALGTLQPWWKAMAHRSLGASYREAGLPEATIAHALSAPATTPWRPTHAELTDAGIVGVPDRPLDVALPAPEGAAAADYADALDSNLAWQALERRHAGSIASAAERMQAARQGGADDAAVQVAAQGVIEALLPALAAGADAALREQFAALLREQLVAVQPQGDAGCRLLLEGDAAARRALPAALGRREATWLIDAAAEPVSTAPPRRPSEIELEVLRRTLGERAPRRLAELWGPARHGGRDRTCERAQALLAELSALPAAERRLAIRVMFER